MMGLQIKSLEKLPRDVIVSFVIHVEDSKDANIFKITT